MNTHESKCRRCGECCRRKVIWKGQHVIMDFHCPAYDVDRHECMVYSWRQTPEAQALRCGERCVSPAEGMPMRCYPATCAYAAEGYDGPVYDKDRLRLVPWMWRGFYKSATEGQRVDVLKAIRKRGA